jgi:uncharacterized membrane protein
MKYTRALLLTSLIALTACGHTKEDRAASGALIGAGAGALVGSTVGAVGQGALIGGAVGAATGAMTDIDTINLGKPWWR